MGYFSNGSEGATYEENVCARCAHGQNPEDGCAVWLAHLMYNYDQSKNPELKDVLSLLIPESNVPGYNDFCTMFHPISPTYADLKEQYQEWLKARAIVK